MSYPDTNNFSPDQSPTVWIPQNTDSQMKLAPKLYLCIYRCRCNDSRQVLKSHLHVAVNKPIEFEIFIVIAEWINKLFCHLHCTNTFLINTFTTLGSKSILHRNICIIRNTLSKPM